MKLQQIFEGSKEDLDREKDLKRRLEIIDGNIEMFSGYNSAHSKQRVKDLKDGREKLIKCFAGELDGKDVPYHIWDLTRRDMPSWGTYGT